jgi:hypothetical protein
MKMKKSSPEKDLSPSQLFDKQSRELKLLTNRTISQVQFKHIHTAGQALTSLGLKEGSDESAAILQQLDLTWMGTSYATTSEEGRRPTTRTTTIRL